MRKKIAAAILGLSLAAVSLAPSTLLLQAYAQDAATAENEKNGLSQQNVSAGTDNRNSGNEQMVQSGENSADTKSETVKKETDDSPEEKPAVMEYADTMVYARNLENGIRLHWNCMEGVDGYRIYRKKTASGKYKKVATIASDNVLYWTNLSVEEGVRYYYRVKGFIEDGEEDEVQASSGDTREVIVRMETVSLKSTKQFTDSSRLLTWTADENASGYEVEAADNRFFLNSDQYTVTDPGTKQMELPDAPEDAKVYIRIRSVGTKGSTSSTSAWEYSSNVTADRSVSRRYWKNAKGSRIEIKGAAGQSLYGYDTIQGGCSDGTYIYEALYNRTTNKSKLVKMRLSDGKVIKKSAVLDLHHANDMAYNPDTGRIAVIHYTGYPMRVSMADPKTLKIKKNVTVQIPDTLYGASEKQLASIKGFTGIAYDEENSRYVLAVKGNKELLICDENLKPLRLMNTPSNGYTNQSLTCTGEYIIRAQSGKTNLLSIYDWDGNLLASLNTGSSLEMEQVFFADDTLYTGYYASGYTSKKVKVNKKTVTRRYLYRNNYLAEILLDLP